MSSFLRIKTNARKEDVGPEETEAMSPNTQYFGNLERPCYIVGVVEAEISIVNGFVTPQAIGNLVVPINLRLSSVIIKDKNGNATQWKKVKVNVEDHVKIPTFPPGLSLESYNKHFDDYLSRISMQKLPEDRPLWEIHVFSYPTNHAPGCIIFKIDHALGDGYSIIGAMLTAFRRVDDPSQPLAFPTSKNMSRNSNSSARNSFCLMAKVLSTTCYSVCDFLYMMRKIYLEDDRSPIRSGDPAVKFKPVRISTISFSLDEIKNVKSKLGVTINDVVIGIIFLAINLYKKQMSQGSERSQRSTLLVPINMRAIKDYRPIPEMNGEQSKAPWGNNTAALLIPIPNLVENIESVNPLDFIFDAQKIIKRKRTSFGIHLFGLVLQTVGRLRGAKVAARYVAVLFKNTSLTVTNLAGPTDKIALANHPIKGIYFMLVGSSQSLMVTIMSYMQTLRIALGVEDGYIDKQRLVECVENAFQMISRAAMA